MVLKRNIDYHLKLEEFELFGLEGKQQLLMMHGRLMTSIHHDLSKQLQLYQLYSFYVELQLVNNKLIKISGSHWKNINPAFTEALCIVDFF